MFESITTFYSWMMAKIYDVMLRDAEEKCLKDWRKTLLHDVSGEVLELGAGTGANLAYYTTSIERLVLTEPNDHMTQQLSLKLQAYPQLPARVINCIAESIPAADQSFDAVVCTLVLCSVKNPKQALSEIRRVLKPHGKLIFIEHVIAKNRPERFKWQQRLEPLWKRIQCNCHVTRDTEKYILEAGFTLGTIGHQSMRGVPPIVRPCIRGVAIKKNTNTNQGSSI